jgi:hypothetical protein
VSDHETVIPELQKEQLQLVSKHFLERSETYFRRISADEDKPYLHFWLRTTLKPVPYKPVLMARELCLSEQEYCELVDLVSNFLKEARLKNKDSPKLKHCTITLLACEGGAISRKVTETIQPRAKARQ